MPVVTWRNLNAEFVTRAAVSSQGSRTDTSTSTVQVVFSSAFTMAPFIMVAVFALFMGLVFLTFFSKVSKLFCPDFMVYR